MKIYIILSYLTVFFTQKTSKISLYSKYKKEKTLCVGHDPKHAKTCKNLYSNKEITLKVYSDMGFKSISRKTQSKVAFLQK